MAVMDKDNLRCVIETCRHRQNWDRLVPLPKDGIVAASWIKACWPYGVVLDESIPFLVCLEHFTTANVVSLLKGEYPMPDQFQSCTLRPSMVECSKQLIWYLRRISRSLGSDMVSRTGSTVLCYEVDELSISQKECSHYLEPPLDPEMTDGDNEIEDPYAGTGVKAEPWGPQEMDSYHPLLPSGFYVADDGRTYYMDARGYPVSGPFCEMTNPFQMMQHPPPMHLAAVLNFDPEAVLKPVCKHGYFLDACLKCTQQSTGMRRQQGVMNCSRPSSGPKASIPFLEPAFREKIHNPFEGCTSLPALKPGAVRTREEGLETQLEASYRGILTKYYSNKWSRKTIGLKVARRYNVSKIECCVCGGCVPDNISLAGHFCAHLEDACTSTDEELHLKLLNPNLTVLMSPDPYAAALNRTCAYCPSQPTFETPFEYIFHLDTIHMHEIKQYRCRICEQPHRNLLELACHLNLCHCGTELPYRCETCGYRTSFYADILFHIVRFHKGEDIFYCPFCLQAVQLKPIYGQAHYKSSRSKGVDSSDSVLYLDCDSAYEHMTLHFDRNEGINKLNPSKYKYCRKCVLHLKAIKDHMKGDHLNIVAGAKASYMSSTDDEEYCLEQGIIGGYDQIGHIKRVKQRRRAVRRNKAASVYQKNDSIPLKRSLSLSEDRSGDLGDESERNNAQGDNGEPDPNFIPNTTGTETPTLRRSRRTKPARKSSKYADYSEFD